MIKSRNIDDLRADVAVNCHKLVERAARLGLPVLVTETVRDAEYQTKLYAQGRTAPGSIVTNTPTPSFHGVGAGLAFDVCKNVKGHEYDDAGFFESVATLAREMGFSWGGDWKSFVDRPHFQWDAHGAYTDRMVRSGSLPPPMPQYEEEETVTQEQFNAMLETYLQSLAAQEPSDWSEAARAWAEQNGLIVGDESGKKQYRAFVTREQLAVILQRFSEKNQN